MSATPADHAATLNQIYVVPIKDIQIGHDNVRISDVGRDLDELAASIKQHGLLQPIVLAGEWGKPPYQLISGQRRFLAYQLILKSKVIKALFAGKLNKTEAIVRSLVENLQRQELEYEDTARAVTYLYEQLGKDEVKVHKTTGLSLQKVREFILIEARATPKIKTLLKAGKIGPVDVKRAIRAAQGEMAKAEALVDLIIKHKPTAHQKRRLVTYGAKDKKASAESILNEAMKPHVERTLALGLPEVVRNALEKATKSLDMEPEELATKVLTDWLRNQGFVDESKQT